MTKDGFSDKKSSKRERSEDADDNASKQAANMKGGMPMDVTVELGAAITPFHSFSDFPNDLIRSYFLEKSGFKTPSAIQSFVWPSLLRGDDLVAIADTGSGKTLAFLAPIISAILKTDNHSKGKRFKSSGSAFVKAVILAPTRELAQQICQMGEPLCALVDGLSIVPLVGGLSKSDQLMELQNKKPAIIVATPGRLNDFIDTQTIDLSGCLFAVLDEADRMLDMGFEPQIRRIFAGFPKDRQTCMFSATWPSDVQTLAREFIRVSKMSQIKAGSSTKIDQGTANQSVKQEIYVVKSYHDRKKSLLQILEQYLPKNYTDAAAPFRVLIFMLYKKTCQRMYDDLWNAGFYTTVLHGDMSQHARNQAISDFRDGKYPILVATDVAARGLDVKDIRLVVNVEMPLVIEDYVHRIGRSGRAGTTGHAITLFCEADDRDHAQDLCRILKESNQKVSSEFEAIAKRAPPPKRLTKKAEPFKLGHIDVNSGASGASFDGSSAGAPKKIYFD
eukprot:ANDGO_00854.mRNA.1 ATP-dependent RNA helicase DBP3